jgi:hypothetical protein
VLRYLWGCKGSGPAYPEAEGSEREEKRRLASFLEFAHRLAPSAERGVGKQQRAEEYCGGPHVTLSSRGLFA